jgi:antagonist of KipI
MSLVFLTNSLLTTMQDLGRRHFRRFGINPNGVMDTVATRLINILLGNDENETALEMHFPAPKILFEENAMIALGGGRFGARMGEREIENWRPVFAERGTILTFPEKVFGNRIYLAVKGGFQIENRLGSGSTNLKARIGGFQGRALRKDDRLFFKQKTDALQRMTNFKVSRSLIPHYSAFPTVRFVPGAEFEMLTEESRVQFQMQNFSIRNESDRMGFRLKGESLNLKEKLELISSAVGFGTVQLLPDGQLIVLMADHQTSGGYPRLAHIISRDLPLAAQLGAGDKLNFSPVTIEKAENLIIEFEKDLNLLKTACRFLC